MKNKTKAIVRPMPARTPNSMPEMSSSGASSGNIMKFNA